MKNDFGSFIKKARESKNMSLTELAAESGISTSQISRIENGQRGIPKPPAILNLARGLKIPYEELMEKAGYFKGLHDDKLESIKDFFANHRILDEKMEKYVDALTYRDKFHPDVINQIEQLIEIYCDQEALSQYEIFCTPNSFKEIIRKADLDEKNKQKFVNSLNDVVVNHLKRIQPTSITGANCIEINNMQDYTFTFEGKRLDESEVLRLKELVLAGLKMMGK